jgi:hypothetical protein
MGAAALAASLSAPTCKALDTLPESAQAELARVAETLIAAPPAALLADEAPPTEGHAHAEVAADTVAAPAASSASNESGPPAAVRAAESLDTAEMTLESKWDRIGCTSLKTALRNTVLVDADWLAALATSGGVLPRCQDVPAEAVVSLAEMEAWDEVYTVGVLVIS